VGQLIVRNVDDELIRGLKLRAAQKRRSAEAEHREILREALAPRRPRRTLKDALSEMPAVGDDADFERPRDLGRTSGCEISCRYERYRPDSKGISCESQCPFLVRGAGS
jgi:antitoxin FitA